MILFTILALMAIILVVVAVVGISALGATGIILFGDIIVCVVVIGFILKSIIGRKRRH